MEEEEVVDAEEEFAEYWVAAAVADAERVVDCYVAAV